MENKQTAMQIMLSELKLKQVIYEQSGMYESATALVTSIETAKELLAMEKEQIKDNAIQGHFAGWSDAYDYLQSNGNDEPRQAEEYYNKTYNVKDN